MNNSLSPYATTRIIKPASVFKLGLLLGTLLMTSPSIAAPITFNTALPVSEKQYIARALLVLDKKSTSATSSEKLGLTSVLGYGVTPKFTVFGILPSQLAELGFSNDNDRDLALGDTELVGRYEVWRADKRGATKRLAPFAGVRLATGELSVSGDGTTDAFAGMIFTSATSKQNIDAQIRYDLNGSDNRTLQSNQTQRFSQGNRISVDLSWQKRVLPKHIDSATKGFWFAVLEGNLSHFQRNTVDGLSDDNSGGFVASIAPGVQYSTHRWIGEAAVRIPIVKDFNGISLEPDYTLFTSLRIKF